MISETESLSNLGTGFGNTRLNLNDSQLDLKDIEEISPIKLEPVKLPSLYAHFDYLRFSFSLPFEEFEKLLPVIHKSGYVLVEERVSLGQGCPVFPRYTIGTQKERIMFAWTEEAIAHGFIDLPGKYVSDMKSYQAWRFIDDLVNKRNCVPSRVDNAIDDPDYSLPWEEINNAAESKNYSGVRTHGCNVSGGHGLQTYKTYYFGSRQSGSFVRIYDAAPMHNVEAQRFEAEFKKKKAIAVIDKFLEIAHYLNESLPTLHELEFQLQRLIAGLAVGVLDFRDKSKQYENGSLKNCPLLPWWESYLSKVSDCQLKVSVAPEPVTFEKRLKWFYRQVAKPLAMFREIMRLPEVFYAFVDKLADSAVHRIKERELFEMMGVANSLRQARRDSDCPFF